MLPLFPGKCVTKVPRLRYVEYGLSSLMPVFSDDVHAILIVA